MYEFNKKSKSISRYLINPEPTILDKAYTFDIVSDLNNDIWLSTNKGLFKVNNRQIVARYTSNDGLPDTTVNSIAIVDDIIWISTDEGLRAFQHKNDRLNKIYLNNTQFNIGLNPGVVYKSDNYLYFGGMEGVIYFKPQQFVKISTPPPIMISDFYLFNQRIFPGTELLPNAMSFTDHLILNHD